MTRLVLIVLAALVLGASGAGANQTISSTEAREILARDGGLTDVTVNGGLDLTGLRHPQGQTLTLLSVTVQGSLRGVPASALEVAHATIGGFRVARGAWSVAVGFERTVFTDLVTLDQARFEKAFACRRCVFRVGVSARRTRFDDEADFTLGEFAGLADFSAAVFRDVSFHGANFTDPAGVSFDEARFSGPAVFTNIAARTALFRGVTFREEATFIGCRVGRFMFAPGRDTETFARATVFGGLADFRRCRFTQGVDLGLAQLQGGARFDGAVLTQGVLDLRALTHVNRDIVLRGLTLGPGAAIAADGAAIAAIVTDEAGFAPTAWRMLTPDTLDDLAKRAGALGLPVASRRLGYAAASERATAADSWTDRAAWALQWPTENFTSLMRPLALAVVGWLLAAGMMTGRGRLAELVAEAGLKPLARVLEPVHHVPGDDVLAERRAACLVSWPGRVAGALRFGFVLVFKLGSTRWRPVAPLGWRNPVLAVLWLTGYGLMGLIGATALQVVPGLRDIVAALH